MSATFRTAAPSILTASILALTLGGCSMEQGGDEEEVSVLESSSSVTNTSYFNGRTFNGKTFNGRTFNGKTFNGKTFNGKNLTGLTLDGSNFKSSPGKGKAISGPDLIGAEFEGQLDDGTSVVIRFDSVQVQPSPHKGSAVYIYTVAFKSPDMTSFGYVCGADKGQPVKTIPLQGKWNHNEGVPGGGSRIDEPDAITFACDGGALYKCVNAGYEPWTTVGGVSLQDHHQACTRMIRADYCGDGQSWTQNGTVINIYDDLGIQTDTEAWLKEAEWDVDGARCLSHQRLQSKQHKVPSCMFELPPETCGIAPQWGETLLVSEYTP